jgi:hypothetical protein
VRAALIALTVTTVAVTVALVPGYVGVRGWMIGSAVTVGLLAVVVLGGSLRRGHDSVWAVSVGPALAAVAILLGTVWASGLVVQARLGPFDSPEAPASVNAYTQRVEATFPSDQRALALFVKGLPRKQAADVLETSGAAGFYILATGREFLPVGGFSGRVPAPSLPDFIRLVAQGRVQRVTVVTKPLTRAPDLRWVVAHCKRFGATNDDAAAQAERSFYYCTASEVSGPVHEGRQRRGAPSPARWKSRNCVTRMNRMRPRPIAGTCWRCRSVTSSGSVSSYSLLRWMRRTAPWARALRTHSASGP